MKTNEVWVYIEQHNGKIADVSLELLGKATVLAEQLQVKVGAVLPGSAINSLPKTLFTYGADKVYLANKTILKEYTPLPYAKVVVDLIKEYQPQIVLYGATTTGRDVAPRIASELRVGLTADCTDLQIGDYTFREKDYKDILYQIRPAFGGNIIATIVSPDHRPQMATVRPNVFEVPDKTYENQAEIIETPVSIDLQGAKVKIKEVFKEGFNKNLVEIPLFREEIREFDKLKEFGKYLIK